MKIASLDLKKAKIVNPKYKIEGFKSPVNHQWYFAVKSARNNKTVMQSEGYKSKSGIISLFKTLNSAGNFCNCSIEWKD